jgi:hypothetical protein
LYEINTRVFIKTIGERLGNKISLANVPDDNWQQVACNGFDLIWLMGVWKRSPRAREEALLTDGLLKEFDNALPGWTADDVTGSPYAIQGYTLDPMLGEDGELAAVKSKLNSMGLGLILDFVPNHVAVDHPWVNSHPGWFIGGAMTDAMANPGLFFLSDGNDYLAHGKDPNFPPWTDTVQVNAFSKDLRLALVDELLKIAAVADGVRCDMAMLLLNNIFKNTWGNLAKSDTLINTEFWEDIIRAIKHEYPDFIFVAEAYWGLGTELISIGFDYIYDKTLYDHLKNSAPEDIKKYITGCNPDIGKSVHFIENHDEPRSVHEYGTERSLAAATIISTLPGMRLFYEGQLQGKTIHLPVQLARGPNEPVNEAAIRFYSRLLPACNSPAFHDGEWMLLGVNRSWENNDTFSNLMSWLWRYRDQVKIAVINYSADKSQGRIKLPLPLPGEAIIPYTDELTGIQYSSPGAEINDLGLYIDLAPWSCHIITMPVDGT